MNIFNLIKKITNSKDDWENLHEDEKSLFNIFMINKILSMNKDNIEIIDILQKNFRTGTYIPNEVMYKCLREIIEPPTRFHPYIKNQNKKTYDEGELEIITKLYEVSQREAKEIIDDMDKDELEIIKQQYKL